MKSDVGSFGLRLSPGLVVESDQGEGVLSSLYRSGAELPLELESCWETLAAIGSALTKRRRGRITHCFLPLIQSTNSTDVLMITTRLKRSGNKTR